MCGRGGGGGGWGGMVGLINGRVEYMTWWFCVDSSMTNTNT